MARIGLKKLLHEIHSRSVWQVLSVYVAGSWGVLQAVEMVQGATGLPDWILPAALVLLLMGLPIVMATAVIHGRPHLPGHQDPQTFGDVATDGEATVPEAVADEESPTRFLTWRNTLLGGAGAATVWVLLAAGWFARDYLSGGSDAAADLDIPLAAAAEPAGGTGGGTSPGDSADAADVDLDSGTDSPAADARPEVARTNGTAPAVTPPSTTPDREAARDPDGESGRAVRSVPDRTEQARAVFQAARLSADSARRAADRLRADETAPVALVRADSAWAAGDAAAAAGRYADATRLMTAAGDRFAGAGREARAAWHARIDSVVAALPGVREAADDGEPRFATAAERERDGERLATAGRLPEAAAAYTEALELYAAIPAPADEPAPAEPAGTETPPAPAPREIVEATLGELARALAAEDLSRVRAIWVSLTEEQAENLSTFFRRWEHIDVRFDPDWSSLVAGSGEIDVTVYTTWRFMESGEAQEQPPFEQTFRLVERDARWVILDR